VIRWLPYAGDVDAAKAKPLSTQVSISGVIVAMAWVAVIAAVLVGVHALGATAVLVSLAVAALVAVLMARWLRRRLGGFTGDTLGATQQLGELAIYLTLIAAR
jgi:adenosylcobinamide-GDP ribazoletransferase